MAEETVQSAAGSPAELFEQLTQTHAELADYSRALVAINDTMAGWDTPLDGGESILFFPPVAGG